MPRNPRIPLFFFLFCLYVFCSFYEISWEAPLPYDREYHFNMVNIEEGQFLWVPSTEILESSNSFSCGLFRRCHATSLLYAVATPVRFVVDSKRNAARFCCWPWSFALFIFRSDFAFRKNGGQKITQDTWMPFAFECCNAIREGLSPAIYKGKFMLPSIM